MTPDLLQNALEATSAICSTSKVDYHLMPLVKCLLSMVRDWWENKLGAHHWCISRARPIFSRHWFSQAPTSLYIHHISATWYKGWARARASRCKGSLDLTPKVIITMSHTSIPHGVLKSDHSSQSVSVRVSFPDDGFDTIYWSSSRRQESQNTIEIAWTPRQNPMI